VLSVAALTRLSIIATLPSTAKPTSRLTHQDLKPSRVSYVLILSNTLIAKAIIKQIPIFICFENIVSTRNSI